MKNMLMMLRVALLVIFFSSQAMESELVYRPAQLGDSSQLVGFLEKASSHEDDRQRIVIVPKKFRAGYIEDAIGKGRLFVAENPVNGRILGYKKAFVYSDKPELLDTLRYEIRAIVDDTFTPAEPESIGTYLYNGDFSSVALQQPNYDPKGIFIYNGADYTDPDFRRLGINRQLTQEVFTQYLELPQGAKAIHLLYGLTVANATTDECTGLLNGRTPDIVASFAALLERYKGISDDGEPLLLTIARYKAFMPTFNPDSEECIPNSDKDSIPGFGYVISCQLERESHERL